MSGRPSTTAVDETQPLLRSVTDEGQHVYSHAPIQGVIADTTIIDFDPRGDPENPLEWKASFKWTIVTMLAMMAMTVTFTCISVVPLASDIVRDLTGSPDPPKSYSVLLVTIWELGEAAGPLLIAPLSEMLGRYPVMNGANLLFVLGALLAATSASVPRLVAARTLTGLAVAVNVLNPAVVGDIFVRDQRGRPLSLIYLAPLIGGAAGPMIGSAVAQALGWRTVLWMSAALAAACEVLFLTCFRETYKVVILARRAKRMEKSSGRRFRTVFDVAEVAAAQEGGNSKAKKLLDAMLRPAIVLSGSGVLMAMCLFSSVVFTFFYIISTTLSDILLGVYRLDPVTVGLCYAVISVGSTMSVVICNRYLDRIYVRMRQTHKGVGKPEFRLPLSIIGGSLLPIAVAAYGWSTQLRLPLVCLLFSVCFTGLALMLAMIPVMAYVVDVFGVYSASAMTSIIVTRCLMGTFLPLSTAPLVNAFGSGWGFSILAGLALILTPIPVLMLRYGEHWRKFSKYSREA
ncbi:hypothetical protein VTK26DRAFT_6011 [Humicola hyalothermophila]